jgi:UDP-glucose 4-epimerase
MLRHHHRVPHPPDRVIVIGAGGFIGGAIARRLADRDVAVVGLGRPGLDLLAADAADRLALALQASDAVVMVSAHAPCKTPQMLVDNIRMMGAVCLALARVPVAHVVYVSSDAVYDDAAAMLTEASPAAPATLHGTMHLAREQMLAATCAGRPLAVLRPTLVYGAGDPHDGYGPNRFRRLANRGAPIVLFGDGEERRDHVCIDDVAEIACRVLHHRSEGVLNVATGTVATFRALAEQVIRLAERDVAIESTPRQFPMPHNGYRPFDVAGTTAAFPDFHYTALAEGLARAQQQEGR